MLFHRTMFINSLALTSMSFMLEKKEGLFERSYAAGKEIIIDCYDLKF